MGQSLMKKLALKPGYRALLLNAPDEYEQRLRAELNEIVLETATDDGFDCALLFVRNTSELEEWATKAIQAVGQNGLLWIAYPKKSSNIKSDLHRDILWAKMEPYRFTGVSLISLDETWSFMRFRPTELVKTH